MDIDAVDAVVLVSAETTASPLMLSLKELLARLHALYAIHRSAHWTAWGESYYGDHLLFQRLYEVLDDEIDGLAERMVHELGPASVDAECITEATNNLVQRWCAEETCPWARGYAAEEELIFCAEQCRTCIEECGKLTLGWEDFLGALTSQHEEHCYLLGQRLR